MNPQIRDLAQRHVNTYLEKFNFDKKLNVPKVTDEEVLKMPVYTAALEAYETAKAELDAWREQLAEAKKFERNRAMVLVMDLFWALREIKGRPTLKDLVKLAKRIKLDPQ